MVLYDRSLSVCEKKSSGRAQASPRNERRDDPLSGEPRARRPIPNSPATFRESPRDALASTLIVHFNPPTGCRGSPTRRTYAATKPAVAANVRSRKGGSSRGDRNEDGQVKVASRRRPRQPCRATQNRCVSSCSRCAAFDRIGVYVPAVQVASHQRSPPRKAHAERTSRPDLRNEREHDATKARNLHPYLIAQVAHVLERPLPDSTNWCCSRSKVVVPAVQSRLSPCCECAVSDDDEETDPRS